MPIELMRFVIVLTSTTMAKLMTFWNRPMATV